MFGSTQNVEHKQKDEEGTDRPAAAGRGALLRAMRSQTALRSMQRRWENNHKAKQLDEGKQ